MEHKNPYRYSKTFWSQGHEIKVHAISTGRVKVKSIFRNAKKSGKFAVLKSFLSRKFTKWMPIWTWVIEHPEGIFLIDTGENARVNDKNYFKSSGRFEHWLNTSQFRFDIKREDEIDVQLNDIGISTKDISKVILTHLHLDHIDGIRHFKSTEIVVNQLEWDKPYGDLPALYTDWFNPKKLELNNAYKELWKGESLTESNDLWLLHTPGHTYGHCSILLEMDNCTLFFAGDVSYSQEQLIKDNYAAANVSAKAAEASYASVLRLADTTPLVYLPSHEWACIDRLEKIEILQK